MTIGEILWISDEEMEVLGSFRGGREYLYGGYILVALMWVDDKTKYRVLRKLYEE